MDAGNSGGGEGEGGGTVIGELEGWIGLSDRLRTCCEHVQLHSIGVCVTARYNR